jgi:hypothetical protein
MSELKHVGVLGMKWGKRKQQSQTIKSSDRENFEKLKHVPIESLTNEQIRVLTDRIRLEKQYKEVTKKQLNPGLKFVRDTLLSIGKKQLEIYIRDQATTMIRNQMNRAQGSRE